MSQMLQMAQVFVSKSGSNIGCHVAQIFIDIHSKLNKICGNSKKREQIEIICKYLENENGRRKKEIYIPMPVKDAVQCFGERDLAKLPKSTFRVWE